MKSQKKVQLVQQGVWHMPIESMPLSSGYLKAVAMADDVIRHEMDIQIASFPGGQTARSMVRRLFGHEVPDILAFSVFGWNFQTFSALSETFAQLNPQGWVIWGGTHAANQAERIFRLVPQVDVIVNGEGEYIFRDLLHANLAGLTYHDLSMITGISFKDPSGAITTTADRGRIQNLDMIPSPFLSGAIEMLDQQGEFRYDVALMETNRGCPYKCAFCYWGGAIGQKIRAFSPERLREELAYFGHHKVPSVVLCDANFGMLPQDELFLEALIMTREKYGFPRNFESSWAKNKSKSFFNIVRRMKETGFRSSFSLALQTLDDHVLDGMNRRNMKVNQWESLVQWLDQEGLKCYAELIWGAPGETFDSFIEGYDRLSQYVSQIAVYPLLLLPNTDYMEKRANYGFVGLRGDKDDFEYVLCHDTMSMEENKRMIKFLFWARVVAENLIFRYIWTPLYRLAGMTQSQVLFSLDAWFAKQTDSISAALKAHQREMVENIDLSLVSDGVLFFYKENLINEKLVAWWHEAVLPLIPEEMKRFFQELLRYELITRPIYQSPSSNDQRQNLEIVEFDGESYYIQRDVTLDYDIPSLVNQIKKQEVCNFDTAPFSTNIYHKTNWCNYVANHEFVALFTGKTERQLLEEKAKRNQELTP
jgi:radical SAM superfamily enzyme YgiQ (UPF0313 family)